MKIRPFLLIACLSITCTNPVYAGIWKKLFSIFSTFALLQQVNQVYAGGSLTFDEACSTICGNINFHSYETPYGELSFEAGTHLLRDDQYTECDKEAPSTNHAKKCCRYKWKKSLKKKKMKELHDLPVEIACLESKTGNDIRTRCLDADKEEVENCVERNEYRRNNPTLQDKIISFLNFYYQ